MSTEEKQPAKVRKPMKLLLLIPLDAVLVAANLLTFAYFHHVNPVGQEQPDISAEYSTYIPKENPHTRPTTTVTDAAVTQATESGQNSELTGDSTAAPGTDVTGTAESTEITATVTAATDATGSSQNSTTGGGAQKTTGKTTSSTTSTTTTTTTTKPEPKPDLSGWGAKWPDKFSYDNTIVAEENFYKSHDLNITITRKQVGNSVAFVADVYTRYYDTFMYAFGHDMFSRAAASLERMEDLAGRKNAVLAINGDFYGQRDTGMLVRAGKVWRDVVKGDVGCYYYDGTFRGLAKNEFDLQTELSNGLFHTMTFGPILVSNGVTRTNIQTSVRSAAPRSGFGYYEPGHYVVTVVDGRQDGYSEGLDIDSFAAFMGDLGCKEAYNLDGGASSIMYFNGRIVNQQSKPRSMSDIFYFGEVQG